MIDYHNRSFRSVANSEGGDVGDDTIFHYRQVGDVVWATYEGGSVRMGTLIAKVAADGSLDMRYHHVDIGGAMKAGRCRSRPEELPDRRIRLHEEWQWTEGGDGSGVSTTEEIK
jgi:hypothetical protein